MALMTPILTSVESFDATVGTRVFFTVTSGDQVVKNRITVRDNTTNEIVYQDTVETFELVTKLLKMTNIDFTKLYEPLYTRPLAEVKFQGYIYQNLVLTENNVAYIKLNDEILKKYEVDSASAGNMINDLKFVEDLMIWVFFSEDTKAGIIKANIRSRGPIINEVAMKYGGGGHIYASGARLKSWHEAEALINDLDEVMKKYNQK